MDEKVRTIDDDFELDDQGNIKWVGGDSEKTYTVREFEHYVLRLCGVPAGKEEEERKRIMDNVTFVYVGGDDE